jgi:hypothetical protein
MSPADNVLSRSQHFHLKADECQQLGDQARYRETKRVCIDLALIYEQLAIRAESIEHHKAALARVPLNGSQT